MLKNNIANALQKRGISQARLSDLAGIPKGMISQIVNGRSLPTTEELALIRGIIDARDEELYDEGVLALIHGREPKQKPPKTTKSVRITLPIVEIIDRYARLYQLSRDEAARSLVMMGASSCQHAMISQPDPFWKAIYGGCGGGNECQ